MIVGFDVNMDTLLCQAFLRSLKRGGSEVFRKREGQRDLGRERVRGIWEEGGSEVLGKIIDDFTLRAKMCRLKQEIILSCSLQLFYLAVELYSSVFYLAVASSKVLNISLD